MNRARGCVSSGRLDGTNQSALGARITQAAAKVVEERGVVSAIDVFVAIGWLVQPRVDEWRTRRLPFLEAGIQTSPSKVSQAMRLFAAWAERERLVPSEAVYVAQSSGREPLQFSESGDPAIERAYRTHWVSPALSEKKRERLEAKMSRPPELVAIEPSKEWTCHRCGGTGSLLVMEPPGPACLGCAGLGDLVILPSGDAGLTRRARAASTKSAVIVRWSRTRKRYERIGLLVEPRALEAAEGRGPDASELGAATTARRTRRKA